MEPHQSDYAAFNLDADYEGGQWIGGEFFYEKERKKRRTTKEEHLYGIFYEGEDEDTTSHKDSFFIPRRCDHQI